jgi:hypothetical protein
MYPVPQVRKLYSEEIAVGREVFRDTIPYSKVSIASVHYGSATVTEPSIGGKDYVI